MPTVPAILALAAWLTLAVAAQAQAQAQPVPVPVPEYELKAAYVFNFALFTDWPADTVYDGGTLNVCVHPASAMRPSLAGIADKTVRGRRLAVRMADSGDSLRPCHLLVLDGADRERWMRIRKALGGAAVLTVTDDEAIAREGAMIALATEGQRLVFDIDLTAARQARLALSSRLLRLARNVN